MHNFERTEERCLIKKKSLCDDLHKCFARYGANNYCCISTWRDLSLVVRSCHSSVSDAHQRNIEAGDANSDLHDEQGVFHSYFRGDSQGKLKCPPACSRHQNELNVLFLVRTEPSANSLNQEARGRNTVRCTNFEHTNRSTLCQSVVTHMSLVLLGPCLYLLAELTKLNLSSTQSPEVVRCPKNKAI